MSNLVSEARLASEARRASAVRLVSKALMASSDPIWDGGLATEVKDK